MSVLDSRLELHAIIVRRFGDLRDKVHSQASGVAANKSPHIRLNTPDTTKVVSLNPLRIPSYLFNSPVCPHMRRQQRDKMPHALG